jgi:periplasmic protein TonB
MKRGLFQVALTVLGLSILPQAQLKPGRIRISEKVSQTLIVSKVQPNYPAEARQKHIEVNAVIQAEISKEGTIEYVKAISGDPLLAQAATEAVKKWKYKPFVLNGEPVPFETQVTVTFTLANN